MFFLFCIINKVPLMHRFSYQCQPQFGKGYFSKPNTSQYLAAKEYKYINHKFATRKKYVKLRI